MALRGLCGILLLLCTLCCGCTADEFDHLMLSREWPFAFCAVQTCTNKQLLQQKFNIHGLWADSAAKAAGFKKMPMFCNFTYNNSDVSPLVDELQENWMDLRNPNFSAEAFWRTEFRKHGSCVCTDSRFNSTYLYFKTALELNEKYNLLDMLSKANIKPGPDQIDVSDVRSALRNVFGFDAEVRCWDVDGQPYLYELRLCFTKDLQPMNCNEKPPGHPSRSFYGRLDRVWKILRSFILGWTRPRRRMRQSGTYECRSDEMVLLPAGVSG